VEVNLPERMQVNRM